MDRHSIFAPASPAFSSKAATVSWGDRKQSLKASDTGMALVGTSFPYFIDYLPVLYSPILRWEETSTRSSKRA